MKINKKYKASITETETLNDGILFLNLDSTGFIKEEIKVSTKVKANLIDPSKAKTLPIFY